MWRHTEDVEAGTDDNQHNLSLSLTMSTMLTTDSYVIPFTTMVCPALFPPAQRQQTEACPPRISAYAIMARLDKIQLPMASGGHLSRYEALRAFPCLHLPTTEHVSIVSHADGDPGSRHTCAPSTTVTVLSLEVIGCSVAQNPSSR